MRIKLSKTVHFRHADGVRESWGGGGLDTLWAETDDRGMLELQSGPVSAGMYAVSVLRPEDGDAIVERNVLLQAGDGVRDVGIAIP